MVELAAFFAVAFLALFVVVEPFGVVPVFASLTHGRPRQEITRIAGRATLVGGIILVGFTLFGRLLLQALDIRVDALRAAGGLLLLLTALDMLRARTPECRCSKGELDDAAEKDDVAIVPLAIPLLAGPGSMATVMVLLSTRGDAASIGVVIAAVVTTFLLSFLVLQSAGLVQRVLGRATMAVVQRVLGLFLAAMSIQFMAQGARALLA